MSVRLKLTFLYTGVLALTLTIFAGLVYVNMSRTLHNEIDQSIYTKALSVVKSIQIPYPLREILLLPDVDVFSSPDTYLQVVDEQGRLAAHSRNLGARLLPLSESTLKKALTGKGFYETVRSDNLTLRIYNLPLIVNGKMAGILQVGRTLYQTDEVLKRLKLFMFTMGLSTVVIAGLLGLSLARVAFRPVEKISETASSIQKGSDLERRIDYSGPRDELGMLVFTINGMLERLETAYRRLERSNEVQRRFVADASHELRTPLTTIRGNAEFLIKMREKGQPEEMDALRDIVSEAERLTRMVAGLLTLARADAGRELETVGTDLGGLLDEVARGGRLLGDHVHFEYKGFQIPGELTAKVNADLIKQVLFIMLDNAFKYTPPGGTVTLRAERRKGKPGEKDLAAVTVSDTGPGIPEEEKEKIFQRFYRGDCIRCSSGSGLGLSIARRIVELHQGGIELRTGVGEGSHFTVLLPLDN
ncbi:periplasmic sensor signal transduction histidine kinase [Desulfocucumis palustris]|uniref:histidine kinase n=1 Tax=Desulfocucumis palustris TaxID=1898651 RepID=A0A2L2XA30_9FIRM|nr:ATP-binding protein [Desulfocucumis palustris]GBF32920.1 periplasmic sensor signal transduction histidine kinase [Desulfocucumis palustris]